MSQQPFYRKKKGVGNKHPWRKCACRKMSFPTEDAALLYAATVKQAEADRTYQCPMGPWWHLTSAKEHRRAS